jgi:hypothetical protein
MKTYEEIMQAYKTARENENAVINDLKAKRDKLEEAAYRYRRIAERKDKEREKIGRKINAWDYEFWLTVDLHNGCDICKWNYERRSNRFLWPVAIS